MSKNKGNFREICKGLLSTNNMKLTDLSKRLGVKVASFDLPAGFTCPAALHCQAYAHRQTGKITKGKHSRFLCYAAKAEASYPNTRRLRWSNLELTKDIQKFIEKLNQVIRDSGVKIMRIHSSGDFYSYSYFIAWRTIASMNPDVQFFGYTKMLDFAIEAQSQKQKNFHLVYSIGGKHDSAALESGVQFCEVITSGEWGTRYFSESDKQNHPIACKIQHSDDYEFILSGESFGIELH